ncbi:lytic murein transglycosylase [Cocleimonas sp. KMM 6892]|uniref:lytic murein transglycosylase n=1 Tax=unclassified Cocleimonas TaxID=2639732 RepID=UPI002DB9A657|nr:MULTISPECIES: lytic murein transglycosylase [unclassified Cocleimonas]MEB8434076.1 lytic murein transglycosylase [Cocleimonas sp. KMM 6892]MEC4717064.1 lytic murein transglycosylase [Cocleimonas sp. KMM 6895]MEC4746348.1 lytic murein transglycosylase [Cocleimonas sp. KMM 6896]
MADANFEKWKQEFKTEALEQGIKASFLERSLAGLKLDPDVIKLDNSQPEFTRSIWDYLNNATSDSRIKKGRSLMKKYDALFDLVEDKYGVQREIILAIWALESDFGRNYGNKNVIRSLATLAYASVSKKRTEFARKELLISLKIVQSFKIHTKDLVGSWAGAMGQPQFMPSSYLKYAVDQNADGIIDLWQTVPDVVGSIAHFLAEAGWRKDESWGVEVTIPSKFDWRLNSASYELRFEQWQDLNVTQINGKDFPYPLRQASLFIPAGQFGPKFLVTHNFEVIKRYNNSSSYALAVAQLSRLLATGEKIQASWPVNDKALSRYEVEEIQMRLNLEGYSPGLADGKIGIKTREAIRAWQVEQGYAGDGYANMHLLRLLRQLSSGQKPLPIK